MGDSPTTGDGDPIVERVPFNPSEYVNDGSVQWGALMGRLGRAGLWGVFISVLTIASNAVGWVQDQLSGVADALSSIDASPVAEPLQTAYDTATPILPDGPLGFIGALLIVGTVLFVADRSIALIGGGE